MRFLREKADDGARGAGKVSALRILVHDFAGHPFQVQLSRALARRGHAVLHHHLANNNGPQGALARRDDDPPGFASEPLYLRRTIDKRNYLRRLRQDFEYGRTALAAARRFNPDVYISFQHAARRARRPAAGA